MTVIECIVCVCVCACMHACVCVCVSRYCTVQNFLGLQILQIIILQKKTIFVHYCWPPL